MAKAVVKKTTGKGKMPVVVKKAEKQEYLPVWDLYRDGLTQGSIARFLSCREQFRLGTVFGWKAKAKSGATEFGSAFHDILAATQHSESGKVLTLDQATEAYFKKTYSGLTGERLQEILTMLGTVKETILRYVKRWKEEDSKLVWVEREKTFNVKFDCCSNGVNRIINLRGRRDGVCQKSDGLWLHETKTKGRIDEQGIAGSLVHNLQTMLYCWSIRKETGKTPKGVIYDVIRTTSLQQRKGRATKAGPAIPESSVEYVKRVGEAIDAEMDWYFMRWHVSISNSDLDRWATNFLNPVVSAIVEWWESIKDCPRNPYKSILHYMNPEALWGQYGRTNLFNALTTGQFFDLEQSKIVYPELHD